MSTDVIPNNVRRFVLSTIRSVPYLEAALWLRSNRNATHSVAELASALYIAEATAQGLLGHLVADQVVATTPVAGEIRFEYRPGNDALAADFDALSVAYASNLVEIARLVHDSTYRNAHRFADAFRLRKD